MVRILTTRKPDQIAIIRGLLEQAGIATVDVGTGQYTSRETEIWLVNDQDADRARRILADSIPTPRLCPECGYDLRGLPEPRCPECGEPFNRPKHAAEWTCAQCGERHEGQFTECWKCGTMRPEPDGSAGAGSDPPASPEGP